MSAVTFLNMDQRLGDLVGALPLNDAHALMEAAHEVQKAFPDRPITLDDALKSVRAESDKIEAMYRMAGIEP